MEMQDRTGRERFKSEARGSVQKLRVKKNILPVRRLIPTHSKYGGIIGHGHNRVVQCSTSTGPTPRYRLTNEPYFCLLSNAFSAF